MLIQLGNHQFNVEFGYNELRQIREWQWGEVSRFGQTPLLQFTGKVREIRFTGTYWNYTADGDAPADISDIADAHAPVGLTDDLGHFYGFWVIVSLHETDQHFARKKKRGIRTDWELTIKYYGEQAA